MENKKLCVYQVKLPSGGHLRMTLHKCALGDTVFKRACAYLNISEPYYFGIKYRQSSTPECFSWVDNYKTIGEQVYVEGKCVVLYFCIKFYDVAPGHIQDVNTKHMYYLQLRRDIIDQYIKADKDAHVALAALVMQAENCAQTESYRDFYDRFYSYEFGIAKYAGFAEQVFHFCKAIKYTSRAQLESDFVDKVALLPNYGMHYLTCDTWFKKSKRGNLNKTFGSSSCVNFGCYMTVGPHGIGYLDTDTLQISYFVLWPLFSFIRISKRKIEVNFISYEEFQSRDGCFNIKYHNDFVHMDHIKRLYSDFPERKVVVKGDSVAKARNFYLLIIQCFSFYSQAEPACLSDLDGKKAKHKQSFGNKLYKSLGMSKLQSDQQPIIQQTLLGVRKIQAENSAKQKLVSSAENRPLSINFCNTTSFRATTLSANSALAPVSSFRNPMERDSLLMSDKLTDGHRSMTMTKKFSADYKKLIDVKEPESSDSKISLGSVRSRKSLFVSSSNTLKLKRRPSLRTILLRSKKQSEAAKKNDAANSRKSTASTVAEESAGIDKESVRGNCMIVFPPSFVVSPTLKEQENPTKRVDVSADSSSILTDTSLVVPSANANVLPEKNTVSGDDSLEEMMKDLTNYFSKRP